MRLRLAIKIIKRPFRGPIRDRAKHVVRRHRFSKQTQRHYGFDRRDFREEVLSEFRTRYRWNHDNG
jgi:hypothetical protein